MEKELPIYKLNDGDIFTLSVEAFADEPRIWNDPHFVILDFERVRLRRWFNLFGFCFSVRRLRKTWLIHIEFKSGETT